MTALFDLPAVGDAELLGVFEPGSPEWHAARADGIGGDLAAPPAGAVTVPVGSRHVALVDECDGEMVGRYGWYLLKGGTGKLYAYTRVDSREIYMHRLIAGTPHGQATDHINGDGLDNRRSNLRPATRSQNGANARKYRRAGGSTCSSPFKGVGWDRARGKWHAKISINGRTKNLGRFRSATEAATAYDIAAATQWGAFAQLNFPATPLDAYSRPRKEASQ